MRKIRKNDKRNIARNSSTLDCCVPLNFVGDINAPGACPTHFASYSSRSFFSGRAKIRKTESEEPGRGGGQLKKDEVVQKVNARNLAPMAHIFHSQLQA